MSANQRVRNFLAEFSKPMSGAELGPEDYRSVVAILKSTLSTSTTSNSPTYRVPATHNLLIHKILGFVAIDDFSAETLVVSNVGSAEVTMMDRDRVKLENCRADLQNQDRNQKIIDEVNAPLSMFTPPVEFELPLVVPAGETVEATFALKDTAADVVGAATIYGFALIGTLVRVKAS